jgi:hypothetical protein
VPRLADYPQLLATEQTGRPDDEKVTLSNCGYQWVAAPAPTCQTPGMAEHAEQGSQRRYGLAEVRARVVNILATVVRWAGLIVAIILVVRVLLTVGGANPSNGITSFITSWSDPLAWGFKDLFTPSDGKLRVLVNYGIAAIFWLVVSSVLARIIRKFG